MTKDIKKDEKSTEFQNVLSSLKKEKEDKGAILPNNKKIIIKGNANLFKGKSLKIDKGLFKDGENYVAPAGTKWEDINNFLRKNISFSQADFT